MAYVQRLEDFNDGIEISEMLPNSQDENDGDDILSPVTAAVASRGVPSLHEYRYSGSYASMYQQDPPGIHAEISCAESEISLGTDFDQVFEMEIGKVPSGKSWDDMRQILYLPSSRTGGGDDQSSSAEYSSIRRVGSSRSSRMRMYSNGEGSFLVPADSDLDQVFEELSEQQATEDKFMAHLSAFRRHHRTRSAGSGLYNAPLCSLKENCSLDDQETDVDKSGGSDTGSTRSESYYTKQNVYEDKGLLPPRSSPPSSPPTPLTNTTKLNHHQFHQRKLFISGAANRSENDAHLASTRIESTKKDDDTAVTSVLTQSTYSYPLPVTIESRDNSEFELSVSPADILHDIGSFQRQLRRRKLVQHSTPPRSNTRLGYDPFDGDTALESSFDPFGRPLRTIKRPAKPRRSLLSEMMESSLPDNMQSGSSTEPQGQVISQRRGDPAHLRERTVTATPVIDSPSMKGISTLLQSISSAENTPPSFNDDAEKPYVSATKEGVDDSEPNYPKHESGTQEDVSVSSSDASSEANTTSVTHETDNTTIATVSDHSNDEERLCLEEVNGSQVPTVPAVDAVLHEEFGILADMEKWDEYPDDFALDYDIMNMRSPSGCGEIKNALNDQDVGAGDEILASRDDDVSVHSGTSSLSKNSDTSSLTNNTDDSPTPTSDESNNLGDKISFHDDEIDVWIASSKEESSKEMSTSNTYSSPETSSKRKFTGSISATNNIPLPEMDVENVENSTFLSSASDETDLSFAMHSGDECDEILSLQCTTASGRSDERVDLFAKNEVLRSINAVAALHEEHWQDVFPEDDYQAYLELRHQRMFTQSISHTMLQSKVAGSQVIGLTLLLNGGDVNPSLWL